MRILCHRCGEPVEAGESRILSINHPEEVDIRHGCHIRVCAACARSVYTSMRGWSVGEVPPW